MIQDFPAHFGGFDRYPQILDDLALANELLEARGPKILLDPDFFGTERAWLEQILPCHGSSSL